MQTKEYFIQLTKAELPATLAAMRAVPAENDSYSPSPKTRSARMIVSHLIGHPLDLIEGIESGSFNHRNQSEFTSYDEAALQYEADTNKFLGMIEATDEKTWDEKPIDFHLYGSKIFSRSLRDMCFDFHADTLHHRGQLSTYYRPMGVKNPVIYGTTKELEEERMATTANQ
ncbi:MAG: DinB family protein [Ignavibacteriota bacterium]